MDIASQWLAFFVCNVMQSCKKDFAYMKFITLELLIYLLVNRGLFVGTQQEKFCLHKVYYFRASYILLANGGAFLYVTLCNLARKALLK